MTTTVAKFSVVRTSWCIPVPTDLVCEIQLDSSFIQPHKYYEIGAIRIRQADQAAPLSKADLNDCASKLYSLLHAYIDVFCVPAYSKLLVAITLEARTSELPTEFNYAVHFPRTSSPILPIHFVLVISTTNSLMTTLIPARI